MIVNSLLITADGGSNGSRVHLWKAELQKLADELGVSITVCHLPPGTSQWNKIDHRLFSFITGNWRGNPLVSYQVIVQLIAATTKTDLEVRSELEPTTNSQISTSSNMNSTVTGTIRSALRPRLCSNSSWTTP